jgi:hypothetical protein
MELSGHSFSGKLAIERIAIALFMISCPARSAPPFGSCVYEGESSISMPSSFAQI